MKPYRRLGSLGEFVCDRFVYIPDYNEEHTQAQVRELCNITAQVVSDNPGIFRSCLATTLPRYEANWGQKRRHAWEKKMLAWQETLTKAENDAWRNKILVTWWSISKGVEDDRRRGTDRLKARPWRRKGAL